MPRAFMLVAPIITALAAAACSDSKGAACTESNDCPSGNVCLTNRCERLCDNADSGCPSGFLCDLQAIEGETAGICVDDARVAPEIASVSGNGGASCIGATNANCMASGFMIEGTFTDSTVFELLGPAEASSQTTYPLQIEDLNTTGTVAELALNVSGLPELAAGRYVLTARNQAGSDESTVQLLQGAPGPDLTGSQLIDRINGASAGVIDASRLDLSGVGTTGGGGGSGGTLYRYDNSTTPTEDTDVGDRMWVRVSAGDTTGNPVGTLIDHARFTQLCGDGDGCDVTLGLQRLRFDIDNDGGTPLVPIDALRTGGSCKIFYDAPSKSWTLDNGCTRWRRAVINEGGGVFTDDGGFRPYSPANAYGFDSSSDGTTDALDGAALPLMSYQFACYLSEAGPDTAGFVDDTDDGFHLILAGSTWADYPAERFPVSDPDRACVLLIED